MPGRSKLFHLYLVPALAVNFFVVLIPALLTFVRSLSDWDGISEPVFIGWANFVDLYYDPLFFQSLWHNLVWLLMFISLPMMLAIVVASLLAQVGKVGRYYQFVFLIPYTISAIVNTKIWSMMIYNDFDGLLAFLNQQFGWNLFNPLSQVATALPAVALIDMWHFWGFLTVIIYAALRQTPEEQLEVAKLEGCNAWQTLLYVTIPHLLPTIRMLSIMVAIWSFLTFDYIYLSTQGGPASSTEVLATIAYSSAFEEFAVGRAAAISVVIGLLGISIGSLYVYFGRRRSD